MEITPPYVSWSRKWLFIPNTLTPTTVGTFSPVAWIDSTWMPPDLESIIQYLASAPVVCYPLGAPPIFCCLCGIALEAPGMWRWDGVWLWFHDLIHLIRSHSVRPPNALVDHIRNASYVWPSKTNTDLEAGLDFYDAMWNEVTLGTE